MHQVQKAGGIDYTEEKMMTYKMKALDLLDEFPDNEARESLVSLINYVTSRKK